MATILHASAPCQGPVAAHPRRPCRNARRLTARQRLALRMARRAVGARLAKTEGR